MQVAYICGLLQASQQRICIIGIAEYRFAADFDPPRLGTAVCFRPSARIVAIDFYYLRLDMSRDKVARCAFSRMVPPGVS